MNKYLFIFTILLFSNSSFTRASVVYSYTSNPYEVVTGSYDTSNYLSAQFTLANEFDPNLTYQLFTPLSYSFSDNVFTIDSSLSNITQQYFEVSTDSSGQITSWVMYATSSTAINNFVASTSTREDESGNATGSGYVLYKPNEWSVAPVPLPGAFILFLSGITGLLFSKKYITNSSSGRKKHAA